MHSAHLIGVIAHQVSATIFGAYNHLVYRAQLGLVYGTRQKYENLCYCCMIDMQPSSRAGQAVEGCDIDWRLALTIAGLQMGMRRKRIGRKFGATV